MDRHSSALCVAPADRLLHPSTQDYLSEAMALRKACTAAVLATAAVVAAALSAARPAVAAPPGAPPATAALRAASGVASALPEIKKVYVAALALLSPSSRSRCF